MAVMEWVPVENSLSLKSTAPVLSAPWVENSPSISLTQLSARSVATSWLSLTVASKRTSSPSSTTSPEVGESTLMEGGVPTE